MALVLSGYVPFDSTMPTGPTTTHSGLRSITVGETTQTYPCCYDVLGDGEWYTDGATPNPLTMAEILAWSEINQSPGYAFAAEGRGLVVYSVPPTEAAERKVFKYFIGTKFEPYLVEGEQYFIEGHPLYVEVTNA